MLGGKQILALAASAALLAVSLSVADHLGAPPVSEGGELAYVREYPEDGLAQVDPVAGEHLTATYVGFTLDASNDEKDRLERFTSRGRMSDTQVFHKQDLPDGTFDALSFRSVDHIERGILLAEGPSACFAVLNGVNAGQTIIARADIEAHYLATGEFDVEQEAPERVEIHRDGHTYVLEASGGFLEIDGGNIRAELPAGSDLRGWIDDEFPATTQVMTREFDHLQSYCGVAEAPDEEPEEVPEEEPGEEPEPAGDASVDKEVASQDDETVTFSIVTENVGDAAVDNVSLVDELPEVDGEWFLGGADSESCGLDGHHLTCDFETLEAGEGRSVTVTGYIQGLCGELPNTATISAEGDDNAANDEDTAVADLGPCDEEEPAEDEADIEVSKEVHEQTEEFVIFRVALLNHGPATAVGDGVYLNDTLPQTGNEWILGGDDSEDCTIGAFSHEHDDGPAHESEGDGQTVTCHWDEVPAGEEKSFTAKSYVQDLCGELRNTATGWAANDVTPENNEATAVALLPPCPEEEEPDEEAPDEEPEAQQQCLRTQGYWKNHPEAWPVDELALGAETYTKEAALDVLWTESDGDASLILAHQLIATKLNRESGADASDVDDAIAGADEELAAFDGVLPYEVPPSSEAGQRMVDLSEELDAWNNSGSEEACQAEDEASDDADEADAETDDEADAETDDEADAETDDEAAENGGEYDA